MHAARDNGCLKIVVYVKRDYKRKSVFIYESKIRVFGVTKGPLLVIVVSKMDILAKVNQHSGSTAIIKKVPDYAKDYKNEFLFIKGIDKCFEYFLENIYWSDMGLLKHPEVDRINKLIDRFEKGQKYNYLNDITNKEIDEYDVGNAVNLLVELNELLDRYYSPDSPEFNYQYFYESVEEDYPGWTNLEKTIKRFLEKFVISVDKYYPHPEIIWPESESESESE